MREEVQKMHTKLQKGWFHEPNMPSMKALKFAMHPPPAPNGNGSNASSLNNVEKFEREQKGQLLKHFASQVMSDDGNYIACIHVEDAEEQ